MIHTRHPSVSLVVAASAAALVCFSACVPDADLPDSALAEDTEVVTADGKADVQAELRARVDGLTVWIDPAATLTTRDGRRVWVLGGRASRNLSEVFSFVPDDPFGTASVISARKFEVVLDAGHEINSMLSGLPILVRVTPTTGEPAFAAVWLAPRLTQFTGSSKVHAQAAVEPIWVAGELVYRGRASTSSPYNALSVSAPSGAAPTLALEATRRWTLDWSFDRLAGLLDPPSDRLVLTGTSSTGATAVKKAGAGVVVTQLGLTRGDPYEVWVTVCEPATYDCLAALPAGQLDTEACGSYRQVQHCGGAPVAAPPTSARLVDDLRAYLVFWYEAREADIVAGGGSSLAAAQAAVGAAGFSEVTVAEDDPHGHDLAQFWVYRHADVVWPGSDIVWFSVYEKRTGAHVESYDFN